MFAGIDVSNVNGPINWPQVKQGDPTLSFVYDKATEGTGYIDPQERADTTGARAQRLLVGEYGFARPDLGTKGADEAAYLLAHTNQPGFLACDIETPMKDGSDLSQWVLDYMGVLEAQSKLPLSRLIIYSYPYFIQQYLKDPRLARYNLWLASYSTSFVVPAPWSHVAIWQYSDGADLPLIPGIAGLVDRDVSYVNLGPTWTMLPGTMLSAQWLQKTPKPNNAIPNAYAPKGAEVGIVLDQYGQPWQQQGASGLWQCIEWKQYQGWVMDRQVEYTR